MLLNVLVALALISVITKLCGALANRLNHPAVIGELVGGILLGPSLLGRLSSDAQHALLSSDAAPFIGLISQLAAILFMFVVGVEFDLNRLRASARSTVLISYAGIVVPLALGVALALLLFPAYAPADVTLPVFALFLGVSLSVTAFPVLARILRDRAMQQTTLGVTALTCAAIDDVTAWCLLAGAVAVARATATDVLTIATISSAYITVMLVPVRRMMRSLIPWLDRQEHLSELTLTLSFAAALLSAAATERIGLHAIFGAFLLGAVIPHDSRTAQHVRQGLEGIVGVLLPTFFALTGMRTEIWSLQHPGDWVMSGVIIAVAVVGKFGGVTLAARLMGWPWIDSSALGILMNTRGLVELIVLNIGLELGILTPLLFTMLVMMAVFTTLMTTPILSLFVHRMNAIERQERRVSIG